MDVVLWILIGLAAGLAVVSVAPNMDRPSSLSASGRRRIRGMSAGMVGAIIGGYAIAAIDPSVRSSGLTIALAALAGALWLAGVVEVYSSRRRAAEDTEKTELPPRDLSRAVAMPAYDAAREALVAGLIEDAVAHEAGRYAEIGRLLPTIRDSVARQDPAWNSRLQLAVRFWRGWADARDARWPGIKSTTPIATSDWPRLARTIASDLALDRDTNDPVVVMLFAYVAHSRVESRVSAT